MAENPEDVDDAGSSAAATVDVDDIPDVGEEAFDSATEQALQFIREKLVMPDEEFYALEEKLRLRAFTVSDVADLDVVGQVWEAIESAVEHGETLNAFRARVAETLTESWGGEKPGRIETIFRTGVQQSYSAGRWAQNSRPEVRATHAYCRFLAVMDGRTSDVCEGLHGTVLPADDEFWATHQPPLHFNCRSDVQMLTEEEANAEGIAEEAPDVEVDEGFGVAGSEFEPDLSTRPAELTALYELKTLK